MGAGASRNGRGWGGPSRLSQVPRVPEGRHLGWLQTRRRRPTGAHVRLSEQSSRARPALRSLPRRCVSWPPCARAGLTPAPASVSAAAAERQQAGTRVAWPAAGFGGPLPSESSCGRARVAVPGPRGDATSGRPVRCRGGASLALDTAGPCLLFQQCVCSDGLAKSSRHPGTSEHGPPTGPGQSFEAKRQSMRFLMCR